MQTITEYANEALDKAFNQTAGDMLDQIKTLSTNPGGQAQRQLAKLDDEAERLKDKEERMTVDNATLDQTIREYENLMGTTSSLIAANDNYIQQSGISLGIISVTAKVFLTLSQRIMAAGGNPITPAAMGQYNQILAERGVAWNTVNTIDQVKNYVDTPAWIAKLDKYGKGYADLARDTILHDIEKGANPTVVARHMRQIIENMPVHASETLMRTLQLTAYRDTSLAMEQINGKYITGKIRIASLDNRTCLACLALHGTPLKPGERVDDHYRGRCTEFYQVPGANQYPSMMQADSTPGNRQFVKWQSGEEWFASLPESRQKAQMSFMKSPGKWKAYKDGTPLAGFVGEHEDDVFGRQIIEKALKNAAID